MQCNTNPTQNVQLTSSTGTSFDYQTGSLVDLTHRKIPASSAGYDVSRIYVEEVLLRTHRHTCPKHHSLNYSLNSVLVSVS